MKLIWFKLSLKVKDEGVLHMRCVYDTDATLTHPGTFIYFNSLQL